MSTVLTLRKGQKDLMKDLMEGIVEDLMKDLKEDFMEDIMEDLDHKNQGQDRNRGPMCPEKHRTNRQKMINLLSYQWLRPWLLSYSEVKRQ